MSNGMRADNVRREALNLCPAHLLSSSGSLGVWRTDDTVCGPGCISVPGSSIAPGVISGSVLVWLVLLRTQSITGQSHRTTGACGGQCRHNKTPGEVCIIWDEKGIFHCRTKTLLTLTSPSLLNKFRFLGSSPFFISLVKQWGHRHQIYPHGPMLFVPVLDAKTLAYTMLSDSRRWTLSKENCSTI